MTRRAAFLVELWIPGLGHWFLGHRSKAALAYLLVLGVCWAVILAHLSGWLGFVFVPTVIGIGHTAAAIAARAAAPTVSAMPRPSLKTCGIAAAAHYALQIALLAGAYAVT